jgi:phage/plasmid-associated DNA primase
LIEQWMAYKVQNPGALPKVAVVFTSEQGGGKGFLGRVLSEILGPENCAVVKQSELGNRFNARWINKLFVLGDEVLSSENIKDISQLLKILIDGHELELEGKNANQVAVRSRLAWMFASNDKVSPLVLEESDRRYSIFTNHEAVKDEHKAMMNACFEADRVTPTAAFREEIAAFAHHLHSVKVDLAVITRPHSNDARKTLIATNRPSADAFCDEVEHYGIESFLSIAKFRAPLSGLDEAEFKFSTPDGRTALTCSAVYAAYVAYCDATGQRPMKLAKLGAVLKHRLRPWVRARYGASPNRVWCYEIPKAEAPPDE